MQFYDVVVLAPHTDDGEIGAGGFISKLLDNGASVTYIAFSAAEESVPAGFPKDALRHEVLRATSKLGICESNVSVLNYPVRKFEYQRQDILEDLVSVKKRNRFDLVLTPNSQDFHQDHKVIHEESIRAFKNTSIFGYELLWNNLAAKHDIFVELSDTHLTKKIDALKEYKTQFNRSYVDEDFIRALAKVRGTQVGLKYAECFENIRLIAR